MGDSHTITEFKELAERIGHADWMVKMLGALSRDPSLQTEAKVEVLLRPVKGVLNSRIPPNVSEQIVKVGIGQLPILRISSIWSNGELYEEVIYRYAVSDEFRIIIPESGDQKKVNGFDEDEWGNKYASSQKWSIPETFKGADFVVVPAKNSRDESVELVIPSFVLNQTYFARSSFLSRALFDAVLWTGLSSLVKLEECGFYNTAGLSEADLIKRTEEIRQKYGGLVTKANLHRLFVVKARSHVRDTECYVLARILSDVFAWGTASSAGKSTMVQQSELSVDSVHPVGWFPFKGESTLTARVYKNPLVNNSDVTRIMVFAIEDCTYKLPFENLLVERTNDGTEADEETDIPDEDKKPTNWRSKKAKKKPGKKNMQSETDADKDNPVENVDLKFSSGIGSSGIDLLKSNKKSSKYKSVPLPVRSPVSPPKSGTSGGMYNRSDIGRTNLESKSEKKPSPALRANLENFKRVLKRISEIDGFDARLRDGNVNPGLYPAIAKSDNKRDWALIEPGKPGLRYFMVGDIVYDDKHFVLMDTQKRKPNGKTKEGFLYEVVRKSDFNYLLDAELASLISNLSEAKGRMKNIKSMPSGVVRTWRHVVQTIKKEMDEGEIVRVEEKKKLYGLQHRSGDATQTANRIVEHIKDHIGES